MKAIDQPTQGAARVVRLLPARGAGWLTLFYKELLRFWKVSFQTILAPVLTALLYLLIFRMSSRRMFRFSADAFPIRRS
jgi:hypothetical protein